MTTARTALQGARLSALLLPLLILLAACSGTPREQDQASAGEATVSRPTRYDQGETAEPRLPPSLHAEAFAGVESALARGEWLRADSLLRTLPELAQDNDRAYRDYLAARTAHLRGQLATADRLLRTLPAQGIAPAIAGRIDDFRRQRAQEDRDYLGSARAAFAQMAGASPAATVALGQQLWGDLAQLSPAALAKASADAKRSGNADWRAWLALARVDAEHTGGETLLAALEAWRTEFPQQLGGAPLPGGLQSLLDAPGPGPDQVALLLPLGGRLGPAARAVLDGYLAGHYAAQARGDTPPQLTVLDTHAYPGADAAYRDAVARGAGLVIGPLSKQAVAELGGLSVRPVPVLALNRAEQAVATADTGLIQMSLAPEDEAQQIAELAWAEGARRALLVRPAGAWGNKMATALQERWQALGGQLATTITLASAEAYSDNLKQGLDLDDSEQRAREVRSMLATNLEFTARRRQDLDAVFLLGSSPAEARALKPLLAFHYAGNLPTYATSSVYGGTPDQRNRDLDGLRLVELPWLLGASPSQRVAIAAGDTGSDSYTRLNALGADAYLLQARFAQLRSGGDTLVRGNTGLLRLDPALQVHREARPATFDGGELEAL